MKRIAFLVIALTLYSGAFAAQVDTVTIFSNSMHKNVKCVVITPDSYSHSGKAYPVVYLLHGYGGNYRDWVKNTRTLQPTVDALNMVVVCPDGAVGSWYFDSPVDSTWRYETNVAIEIPDFIDAHYRTIANRDGRAITGLSMGGHGALYLGIRHKDRFGAAGSMSGGVDFRPFPNNWDIAKRLGDYQGHPEVWDANTVMTAVDQLKDGEINLVFECGVDDFFINVNRALHAKLVEKKVAHDYTERPGKHNWQYWDNALPYQLLYLHRFFGSHGR